MTKDPTWCPGSRVFIVVPVHDRWELTRLCLQSLEAQSYSHVSVVVVDDGSADGTDEGIAREFPSSEVVIGDGGLWWTGATNAGIDRVLGVCQPDDYVLTLNNDVTVNVDYVATLVTAAGTDRRALVGSVAVDSRDRETIVDGGPHVDWRTARMWSANAGRALSACVGEGISHSMPDMLPGRGTLVPVACLREIGPYDAKRLPHYGADYEFSVRARRAGYRLVMSYEAPVFSEVEATGVSTMRGRLPWRAFFGMFVSRRSPSCLLYRWRFARSAAPRALLLTYLIADTVRVVGGALRGQLLGGRR